MSKHKAIMLAASKSGSGKTLMTIGLLYALVKKGLKVQSFKCGPDFIDPSLHTMITGRPSYNLDLKMMGEQCCIETYKEKGADADICVIEGVMGLFDGGIASSAALAKCLDIEVVLIVDARSSAESSAAVLRGFELYDPELALKGVIFNYIGSPRHRELIDLGYRGRCVTPIVGYLPREGEFKIKQRHLGLHMGEEQPIDLKSLEFLARLIEKNLNLEMMLKVSDELDPYKDSSDDLKQSIETTPEKKLNICIARDEAFCFYYQQNLEIFRKNGFDITFFSPLHDKELPAACDLIYFGGGYPELYAQLLSSNKAILEDVREKHAQNTAIYSECGGFMYLCKEIIDGNGNRHPMAGIFPFTAFMNKGLRKLGYRQAVLDKDCMLGNKGDRLYGHEFHYSDIKNDEHHSASELSALYIIDNNYQEGYVVGSAVGSYIHLHFGRTEYAIRHLYDFLTSKL